jgi:hypothetical protein
MQRNPAPGEERYPVAGPDTPQRFPIPKMGQTGGGHCLFFLAHAVAADELSALRREQPDARLPDREQFHEPLVSRFRHRQERVRRAQRGRTERVECRADRVLVALVPSHRCLASLVPCHLVVLVSKHRAFVIDSQIRLATCDWTQSFGVGSRFALTRRGHRHEEARQRLGSAHGQDNVGMGLRREICCGQHRLNADGERRLHPVVNSPCGVAQKRPQRIDGERLGRWQRSIERPGRFPTAWGFHGQGHAHGARPRSGRITAGGRDSK